MRISAVLFMVGLIFVLLFEQGCDCERDPIDPQHYWVICKDDGLGQHEPALTNGKDIHYSGQLFDPSQWRCPDTSGSPIWTGSGKPIYGTGPIKSALFRNRAAGPGAASYLPTPLLDLPFPARPAGNENSSFADCSPNQPDVLQVNHDNASVNRIATCPMKLVSTIKVASRPLQLAITPDGSTAIVTSFDAVVNFIDLATNQVTFSLHTGAIAPNGIAISPDGAYAYITSFTPTTGAVVKIDLATRTIVGNIATTEYPQNIFITPDGEQLYVTCPFDNLVLVIDALTFRQGYSFAVPGPRGIAFNSKGTKAYIASAGSGDDGSAGNLLEFNTNTFQIANTFKVGLGPNDVAVLYGDQFVVTTNYEGKSISKLDAVAGTVQTTPVSGYASGLSIVY